jgi:Flp pilus assembly protein TadB
MELDNLKYVWKRLEEDRGGYRNEDRIREILSKRQLIPVSRMKRNLLIELLLACLLYTPLCIWYWFDFNHRFPEVSGFLLLLLVFFMVYYYRKSRLLTEMQNLSCPVKENLERRIATLEKYIRFYLILGGLIPVCILFLGLLMYGKLPRPSWSNPFYTDSHHSLWQVILLWTAIVLFASIAIYFLDRWYVNRLYNRQIKKLKEMLREINE